MDPSPPVTYQYYKSQGFFLTYKFGNGAQDYCLLVQDTDSQKAKHINVATYTFPKWKGVFFFKLIRVKNVVKSSKIQRFIYVKDTPFPVLPMIT